MKNSINQYFTSEIKPNLKAKNSFVYICLIVVVFTGIQCINQDLKNIESLKKCKVDFNSVQLKNIAHGGLFGLAPKIEMDTEIAMTNPNESEVNLYAFDFDVSLLQESGNGELLGKIISDQEIIIPANTTQVIPVKIRSDWQEKLDVKLIRILSQLMSDVNAGKDPEFLIEGSIQYKTIFGNLSIPVREVTQAKLRKK
ncbi:LEA type 2 family protein [Leptospira sp. GIMC2001]|uniref:NDR1/HIN1-like protein n=1 Tax=Leptospira sp. GIMC2001 TaxID=1513297 RepID=UPI00234A8F9B|nr:LEA type 2 family protein [Leptospira sp. GIMC2001]WCL49608.1 LEA type 2 family protein [Leptospira sp. GIMC2001]